MRFIVPGVSTCCISLYNTLPEKYAHYKCNFGKSILVESPKADIIYHEKESGGVTVLNTVVIVKQPLVLIPMNNLMPVFTCMLKGSLKVNYPGQARQLLLQGRFVLIPPALCETQIYFKPGTYEFQQFSFPEDLVHQYTELQLSDTAEGAIEEDLYEKIRQVKYGDTNNRLSEMHFQLMIRSILVNFLQQFEGNTDDSDTVPETVASYLRNNLDSRCSLPELADKFYVSESTLRRLFHKRYGCTPADYQHKMRMKTAVEMLKEEKRTVADVAYSIGYKSVPTFCRLFKKYNGKAPGELKGWDNKDEQIR